MSRQISVEYFDAARGTSSPNYFRVFLDEGTGKMNVNDRVVHLNPKEAREAGRVMGDDLEKAGGNPHQFSLMDFVKNFFAEPAMHLFSPNGVSRLHHQFHEQTFGIMEELGEHVPSVKPFIVGVLPPEQHVEDISEPVATIESQVSTQEAVEVVEEPTIVI